MKRRRRRMLSEPKGLLIQVVLIMALSVRGEKKKIAFLLRKIKLEGKPERHGIGLPARQATT